MHARTERLTQIIGIVRRINAHLLVATEEQELFQFICDALAGLEGIDAVWIGLRSPRFVITPAAAAGFDVRAFDTLGLRWDGEQSCRRPVSRTLATGSVENVPDLQAEAAGAPWSDGLRRMGVSSVVSVPIRIGQDILGALVIWSGRKQAFDGETVELLTEVAGDIAIGVRSLRLGKKLVATLQSLEAALAGTVEVIARIVETRDPYTAGHQRGVAALAESIASELGLPEKQREGLKVMGYLHDVGKIGVPAEILSKPVRLNPHELSLVRRHAEIGHDILKDLSFPWPVAEAVLQHHERLDGSGYPRGLKGEEILFEARILAVADAVEAMGSHRPYRAALSAEAVQAEIAAERGILYAPEVVDACLRVLRRRSETRAGVERRG